MKFYHNNNNKTNTKIITDAYRCLTASSFSSLSLSYTSNKILLSTSRISNNNNNSLWWSSSPPSLPQQRQQQYQSIQHRSIRQQAYNVVQYHQQKQQQQQQQQQISSSLAPFFHINNNNNNNNYNKNYVPFLNNNHSTYYNNNNGIIIKNNNNHHDSSRLKKISNGTRRNLTTDTTTIQDAEIIQDKLQDMFQLLGKQSGVELNDNEKRLKLALQQLSKLKDRMVTKNDILDDEDLTTYTQQQQQQQQELITSMEQVRECYENLFYWEYALEMEQNIEQVLLASTSIDNNDTTTNDSSNKIAQSWYRQGKYYHRLQQYSTAQKLYDKSYRWFLSTKEKEESYSTTKIDSILGSILLSMAGIQFTSTQNYPKAIELLLQSESYYELAVKAIMKDDDNDESNNRSNSTVIIIQDSIKCKKHLGLVYRTMEEYQSALQQYQVTFELLQQYQASFDNNNDETYHTLEQGLLFDIADMYSALEQYDDAIITYQIVLEKDRVHRQKSNMNDDISAVEGIVYHNIGKIHAQQNELDLSITELEKAIEIKSTIGGELNSEVGKTYNLLGAVYATRAKRRLQQQQQQQNEEQEDDIDNNDTSLQSEKDMATAYQCFQQALLIAKSNCPTGTNYEDDPDVQLAIQNLSKLK